MMLDLSQNPLCRPFDFPGSSRHGILLLHGFTATPGTMLPLGQALAKRGLRVKAILLPGHGTTVLDMERRRWTEWLAAAQEGFDQLARECEQVSVAGLSMGGALTLLLAQTRSVYKAAPICAALKVRNRASRFAKVVWPVMRYHVDRPCSAYSDDFLEAYNACYDRTPVRSVAELNALMKRARRGLHKICCPLLVIRAGQDETVLPESAELIMNETSSVNKRLLTLPNSPHVCTLGPERERLFSEIAAFLASGACQMDPVQAALSDQP